MSSSPARAAPPDGAERVDELLTVPEVAALLRLTSKGVYAMVENRRIPFVRVSNRLRFLWSDVLAFVKENRVPTIER
jgi:excisionase family DNA binding protein